MRSNFKFLAVGLIVVAIVGCKGGGNSSLSEIGTDTFLVKTEFPQKRDIQEEIMFSGTVKAKEEAVLYPRISGKLLRNVLKEGDKVKRNQTVALIERDEVGAVFEPAPVPSTISGVVGRMYLDAGETVTIATPIALIVNISKVRVKINVPERYISKIYFGQSAQIEVEAFNEVFNGKVYKISPVVDVKTRSAPIEILVDNPAHKIKSGMFAQVKIVTGKRQGVLSISKSAFVTEKNSSHFVFVAEKLKAQKRKVKLGLSDDNFIEVIEGLTAKNEVVNFGLYGLKDQSKIKIEGKEGSEAEGKNKSEAVAKEGKTETNK
ncbi:MAG TPA: efflux RND transporter periplasmic adaptor subunit [Elusimicrobiales bacterium]|nr:efflux RND transporter periplasmic adaptor subunit [Elusimicrobiales bacterium]